MSRIAADRIPSLVFEHGLKPFGIAFCFVLVALIWTFPLQHLIEYPFVFLFLGAIMGSAWFGGIIAGLIAVVLSSGLIWYFFIPPLFSVKIAAESRSFVAAFILCALAISIVSSTRKRAENAVREARDLLETKVQERTAELERSNREILQGERELRLLTEAIPQQIWRADPLGVVEYVNQNLREYIGGSEDALQGEGLFRAIHPEDQVLFQRAWKEALSNGQPFEVETRIRSASAAYRWFLLRGIPQRSEDSQLARWYGIHIDIEEQRRMQQTLTARQENLSRLSRTLSMAEMAASIAHELNQPMTALVSHAYACHEWALGNPPNLEKVRSTAEKIVQEGTRASDVVRRVRALFSSEDTVREPSDLNLIIIDLARLLRDEAIREGVTIQLALKENLPRPEIDPVQIQQVLVNLSRNAMEAMSRGARAGKRELTFETERMATGEVLTTVADTGPGLDPRLTQQIFEPFFSTKKNGTGIGLAICRSIIEAHDGHIWASNSETGGASIQFTLPTLS